MRSRCALAALHVLYICSAFSPMFITAAHHLLVMRYSNGPHEGNTKTLNMTEKLIQAQRTGGFSRNSCAVLLV